MNIKLTPFLTTFIYLLAAFSTSSVFGQIIYTPTFINPCTGENAKNVNWYLSDSTRVYVSEDLESNYVVLPNSGTYKLHIDFHDQDRKIEIKDEKHKQDTIVLKRLTLIHFISNPPTSRYFDCNTLANDSVIDYYGNGNKRIQGFFIEGKFVDTLFEFYRNEHIYKLTISTGQHWKEVSYFNDGQIKSIYDTKARQQKTYDQMGVLKKQVRWSRRKGAKTKEYYKNGSIHIVSTSKKQKRYNSGGQLVEKIRRKKISILDMFMNRKTSIGQQRTYKYIWKTFGKHRKIKSKFTFFQVGFLTQNFPDSLKLKSIENQLKGCWNTKYYQFKYNPTNNLGGEYKSRIKSSAPIFNLVLQEHEVYLKWLELTGGHHLQRIIWIKDKKLKVENANGSKSIYRRNEECK